MLETQEKVNSAKELFLFFGDDLAKIGVEALKKEYRSGHCILPLDTSAVGLVQKVGLPFSLIDQWLGVDDIIRTKVQAASWENDWFLSEKEKFTADGICWPIFDHEAMYWFWRDLTLFNALADKFNEKGGQEISILLNKTLRPAVYYFRSDIYAIFLSAVLGNKAKKIIIPQQKDNSLSEILSTTSIISFTGNLENRNCSSLSLLEGKIILALNPGEINRFKPVIKDLVKFFPGNVAIVTIYPCPKEIVDGLPIPVISPSYGKYSETRVSERFSKAFSRMVDLAGGYPWQNALRHLKYHFQFYCKYRWPVLASNFKSWHELWSQHKPRAVIVSSLADSESKLPAEAAKRSGIPTFTIPHGGAWSIGKLAETDTVLYNSVPMRKVFEHYGTSANNLKPCRGIIDTHEYPVSANDAVIDKRPWKVLVLTNPIFYLSAFPAIHPFKQIEALKALDQPPENISKKLSLTIKAHPKRPDIELFPEVSRNLAEKVVNPNFDLNSLLEQTELIIALNYSGAALFHALRSGKPVIFFWTDPFINIKIDPGHFSDLLLPAGLLVHSKDELWKAVEAFFTNPEFAKELILKGKEFTRSHLDEDNYPSVSDVVHQVLSSTSTVKPNVKVDTKTNIRRIKLKQLLPKADSILVKTNTNQYDCGQMPVSELIAICKIVRHKKPSLIFEFGTYRGGTTLRLAANSNTEVYTFDLPPKDHNDYSEPLIIDPELDVYPEEPGIIFRNTPHAQRIHQIFGNSQTHDFSSFYNKVDLVFVDASHRYDFVLRDSMNAFKMIKPDGIIIWHDYEAYAPEVMKALDVVSTRFPLFHIEGTSLAVYFDKHSDAHLEDIPKPEHGTKLSVIIPTYNRSKLLEIALESVLNQSFPSSSYEIIVVDNGSKDKTKDVVSGLNEKYGGRVRYVLEKNPGLVNARHAGAQEANGEILCFIDDDAYAAENWLQGIVETFQNTDAVIVGGKILPEYETDPPAWVNNLWTTTNGTRHLSYLSLLDFGDKLQEIDPGYVWGCNYSIKKTILFEMEGFNPDSLPQRMIKYRGDGETGLSQKIKAKGYKAFYNHKATVYHFIPKDRLTARYLCKRWFNQGVSDSYSEIRKNGQLIKDKFDGSHLIRQAEQLADQLINDSFDYQINSTTELNNLIHASHRYGRIYHQSKVKEDPGLLEYILRKNYMSPAPNENEIN